MTNEVTFPTKYQRLLDFFELLRMQHAQFDNPQDALNHVCTAFKSNEDRQVPESVSGYRMQIINHLAGLVKVEEYQIHYLRAPDNIFFFSFNGAYAIYELEGVFRDRKPFDLKYFLHNPNAILMVPNIFGLPLWQD
jgi:hypothetical protein